LIKWLAAHLISALFERKIRVDKKKNGNRVLKLDLRAVEKSLKGVERDWERIDDELERRKIGRKDTPFNSGIREHMMSAYERLDGLLRKGTEPFSDNSISDILELNNLVHYGTDNRLRLEYIKALNANTKKYYENIGPIIKWHKKHIQSDSPLKVSAEIYVAILGHPQLFFEGNHRTGSIISSWVSMYHGHPPFVLSSENAIAYFAPSAQIKAFADKSTWRGRRKLPKYRKSFKEFWESNIDESYVQK